MQSSWALKQERSQSVGLGETHALKTWTLLIKLRSSRSCQHTIIPPIESFHHPFTMPLNTMLCSIFAFMDILISSYGRQFESTMSECRSSTTYAVIERPHEIYCKMLTYIAAYAVWIASRPRLQIRSDKRWHDNNDRVVTKASVTTRKLQRVAYKNYKQ